MNQYLCATLSSGTSCYRTDHILTLLKLSECHAKLHLRSQVNLLDATVAIMCLEETMLSRRPVAQRSTFFDFKKYSHDRLFVDRYDGKNTVEKFQSFFQDIIKAIGFRETN